MKKKYFPLATIIGALLIFSILPIINYIADPSRILHHDYSYRYEDFHPNKLSLKTLYLLKNKNKYDTLVYGSSRGEFVDASLISKNAYNMTHGFGTVGTYLNNLKTLLENGVKLKNVWISINDYVIWKDQTDSLIKLIYQDNLLYDAGLYARSLFTLNPKYIKILKDKNPLIKTQEVTDPNQRTLRGRKQEHIVQQQSKRYIPAATLGYTGQFRVKKAIEEIAQIKALCEENDINLTVLMYPIYWKTYLIYDQDQINMFKKELVDLTSFYDFYDLSEISLDQKNWFEGSHFTPSVGDYIIQSIKHDKHLVTKENIDQRIKETKLLFEKMPFLEAGGIFPVEEHTKFKLKNKDLIFDIQDKKFTFFKNNDFTLDYKKEYIESKVTHTDPLIILDKTKSQAKSSLLFFSIESPKDTLFQIYFKDSENAQYSEANRYNASLKKGINTMHIIIPSKYINNQLRVDIARNLGLYKIKEFKIYDYIESDVSSKFSIKGKTF